MIAVFAHSSKIETSTSKNYTFALWQLCEQNTEYNQSTKDLLYCISADIMNLHVLTCQYKMERKMSELNYDVVLNQNAGRVTPALINQLQQQLPLTQLHLEQIQQVIMLQVSVQELVSQ